MLVRTSHAAGFVALFVLTISDVKSPPRRSNSGDQQRERPSGHRLCIAANPIAKRLAAVGSADGSDRADARRRRAHGPTGALVWWRPASCSESELSLTPRWHPGPTPRCDEVPCGPS